MSKQNMNIVKNFYQFVASGNASGVLSLLHDDLHWTEAEGFPYYSGTWRKPQDVVERLLVPLMRDWSDFSAKADDYMADGERVVAFGVYAGTAKATGKSMRVPFAHLWRVRDHKITHFDMFTDTLLVHRAYKGGDCTAM